MGIDPRAVEHYRVDMPHALEVREAAMYLFSALASVHRLPPEYREWLSAAAMLYEVGDYVNRSGRHRHTHYIFRIRKFWVTRRSSDALSLPWRAIWENRGRRSKMIR